jgi:formylmethanofuran dehydrogenase subunit E
MIGWCEACGKGPVPCAHIESSMGDSVQCYTCTEGEFDPYGEMDDGETVQCYVCTEGGQPLR